jgi:heme-degrading monooxygenase HmoA
VIARYWRVWASVEGADDLEPYLRRTGVGDALRTPGNQGALLLRSSANDGQVEFTLLTFWPSWDAIRAFAGDDVSRAVLYPEDRNYFTTCDEQVKHLVVAAWDGITAPPIAPKVAGGDTDARRARRRNRAGRR